VEIFVNSQCVKGARIGRAIASRAQLFVQEAHDLAAIAHAATLESRVPFNHFFDG
jgi:pyruvate-ferredoxin/flavodoxin oxidoreductase